MCSFMRQPSQPIGSAGPAAGPDKLNDHRDHDCAEAGLTNYQIGKIAGGYSDLSRHHMASPKAILAKGSDGIDDYTVSDHIFIRIQGLMCHHCRANGLRR